MFKKNNSLSFAEKQLSVRGIFSVALGLIAMVICIVAVVLSYIRQGKAGQIIGSCGIMALLSSFMGLLFGIGGMFEKDKHHIIAVIGFLISALVFAGLICLFVKEL